ncbi:prolyl oligopeptidase family serine peptidase [Nonomuraea sp. NPDC050547]|uniref:prolyl oligopeptidase family serine peptidase n=1 Tax=Nonomuraea sp. NPDC050547 TaxID=3364368 RepID=UPI003790DD9D
MGGAGRIRYGSPGRPIRAACYLAASMTRRGVDARFLIYPDEGHGLEDPHNQRDLIDRAAAWIDARCA